MEANPKSISVMHRTTLLVLVLFISACSSLSQPTPTTEIRVARDVSLALPISIFNGATILDPLSIRLSSGASMTVSPIGRHDIPYIDDIRDLPEYIIDRKIIDTSRYSESELSDLVGMRNMLYGFTGQNTILDEHAQPERRIYIFLGDSASAAYITFSANPDLALFVSATGIPHEEFRSLIIGR